MAQSLLGAWANLLALRHAELHTAWAFAGPRIAIMKFHPPIVAAMMSVALTPACGASDESNPAGAGADDIATYRQSVIEVRSSATAYQTSMLDEATATVATCQELQDQYDSDVRPHVLQVEEWGIAMDTFMGQHGGSAMADVDCAGESILSELDEHHARACRLADLTADQAEAVRHVGVVTSYTHHLDERAAQMMNALGGGAAGWGPMMHGCEGWEGSSMMQGGMMHGVGRQ